MITLSIAKAHTRLNQAQQSASILHSSMGKEASSP